MCLLGLGVRYMLSTYGYSGLYELLIRVTSHVASAHLSRGEALNPKP